MKKIKRSLAKLLANAPKMDRTFTISVNFEGHEESIVIASGRIVDMVSIGLDIADPCAFRITAVVANRLPKEFVKPILFHPSDSAFDSMDLRKSKQIKWGSLKTNGRK